MTSVLSCISLSKCMAEDPDRSWVTQHIENIGVTMEAKRATGEDEHINMGHIPEDVEGIQVPRRRVFQSA